jgi:hypothetical protein
MLAPWPRKTGKILDTLSLHKMMFKLHEPGVDDCENPHKDGGNAWSRQISSAIPVGERLAYTSLPQVYDNAQLKDSVCHPQFVGLSARCGCPSGAVIARVLSKHPGCIPWPSAYRLACANHRTAGRITAKRYRLMTAILLQPIMQLSPTC